MGPTPATLRQFGDKSSARTLATACGVPEEQQTPQVRSEALIQSVQVETIIDLNPNSAPSDPGDFTLYDGQVYFSADDGSNGRSLYGYDGNTVSRIVDDWYEQRGEKRPDGRRRRWNRGEG